MCSGLTAKLNSPQTGLGCFTSKNLSCLGASIHASSSHQQGLDPTVAVAGILPGQDPEPQQQLFLSSSFGPGVLRGGSEPIIDLKGLPAAMASPPTSHG